MDEPTSVLLFIAEAPDTCPRDAFTNQYNFQSKDPIAGEDLAVGCYTTVIEVEGTNQTIGSEFGPVTTLEITLLP